jgi:hypothetical protein
MDTMIVFSLILIFFYILFITSPIYNHASSINNVVVIKVPDKEIYLSDFQTRYKEFLYSTSIKDNFITRRYIPYNIVDKYLLYDKVTPAVITPIKFSNNRPHFARVLILRIFLFQLTNFIT